MPLTFQRTRGHNSRTGTYLFDMLDGGSVVQCGVSDAAMDDAERRSDIRAHERDDQFERLRDRVLDCASRKYYADQFEQSEPRILVKTADLNP
ncbi:DUF1488 family protein [Bradyrhizobium sp. cf659]|uniref:DUF1488 family protein n=1 Tax=Bradyrhizobium sp. cf659 TaxID=1761771 RepID=UPI000B882453|nr:DUF1488 family protein [Bradyrhizobium sp. cf659]